MTYCILGASGTRVPARPDEDARWCPCPAPAPAGTVRTGAESWTCRTCAGCAVVLVRTPSTTSCPTRSAAAMMRTIFVRLIVRATPRAASGGGIGSARSGRPAPGSGLERFCSSGWCGVGSDPGRTPRGQARQCFRSPSDPLIPIPPTFFRRTRFFGGISTFYCRRGGGGRCGASLWRRSRSRKGPGPMGAFASAVRSCDRLRILRAQRRRLAEELDLIAPGTNPAGVATLSRQLVAVMREIAAVEAAGAPETKKVSPVDELARRRRDRRAGPAPAGGRQHRLPR